MFFRLLFWNVKMAAHVSCAYFRGAACFRQIIVYLFPHPSKNVCGLATVEGARTIGTARCLCDAHQTVVRPAHAVQGYEIVRHDVKNVASWQPACSFVKDLRRQLLGFGRGGGVQKGRARWERCSLGKCYLVCERGLSKSRMYRWYFRKFMVVFIFNAFRLS